MLEGIEPSIALTGGPWYTDNELDTEFIQNLTEACYKLISDIVSHTPPPSPPFILSFLINLIFRVSPNDETGCQKEHFIPYQTHHDILPLMISDIPLERHG